MKKAIAAVSLCVALTLCMSLSAFAQGSAQVGTSYWDATNFTIYSAYTYDSYGGLRPHYDARIHYSTNDVNGMFIYIGETTESSRPYCGFKVCLNVDQAENTRVDGGHYFVLTLSFEESCPNGNYNNNTGDPYINISVSNSTGTPSTIRAVPEYVAGSGRWTSTAIIPVGSGNPLQVEQITLDSNIYSPRLGQDPYSIFFKCQSTVNLTEAQKIAEEQKQAIEDAANQISGSIDDAATDITNAIGDAADDIINNDLGYKESEDQADAKNGIQAIKKKIDTLSDDIDQSVEDFSASIDGLKTSINSGKTFVWGWLDYVPVWVTAIIVGFAGILIARKVVK